MEVILISFSPFSWRNKECLELLIVLLHFLIILLHIYIGDNFSKSHTHMHKHKDILNASFPISDPPSEHLCHSECCFPGNVHSTSEFGNLKIIKPFSLMSLEFIFYTEILGFCCKLIIMFHWCVYFSASTMLSQCLWL